MRPFLIVEDKAFVGAGSDCVCTSGDGYIGTGRAFHGWRVNDWQAWWDGIGQCLTRDEECFVVHILVKDRQKDEVSVTVVVKRVGLDAIKDAISDLFHVSNCFGSRRQR